MALTYLGATAIVPNYNIAGIAKAALESIVRYLAYDLGDRGIRVNAISAGPISTASSRQVKDFKSMLDKVAAGAPLRRNITPDDVGNTAVYLASDLSRAVTADVHFVDAGYHAMGMLAAKPPARVKPSSRRHPRRRSWPRSSPRSLSACSNRRAARARRTWRASAATRLTLAPARARVA